MENAAAAMDATSARSGGANLRVIRHEFWGRRGVDWKEGRKDAPGMEKEDSI
jgi:hypothetical protein